MFKIRTYNQISNVGLGRFPLDRYQVGPDVEEPNALVLRSHKLHDEPIAETVIAVEMATHQQSVTHIGQPSMTLAILTAARVTEAMITQLTRMPS